MKRRRLQRLCVGLGIGAVALLVAGCPAPADLAAPETYPPLATTGGSGGPGPVSCELPCVTKIFKDDCGFCHGNGTASMAKLGDLDLVSPGVSDRLKNVPAKHTVLATKPMAACVAGAPLVNGANPADSWLLKKIEGQQGTCGDAMPTARLAADKIACLTTYTSCLGGGTAIGGSGGMATGGGGAGGMATAGGGAGGKAGGGAGGKAGGTGGAAAGTAGTGGT